MDQPATPSATPQRSLGTRFALMLVTAIGFHVAGWLLGFTAILQLALSAFTDGPNARAQAFGADLGRWFAQAARFLTFDSEDAPFPFADWPAR